jgi:hypothetical protein
MSMDDIRKAIAVLREFLAGFYSKANDMSTANRRAINYLVRHPDYRSVVLDAFKIVLRNSLSPDTFLNLVQREANRADINDSGKAREFLQSVARALSFPNILVRRSKRSESSRSQAGLDDSDHLRFVQSTGDDVDVARAIERIQKGPDSVREQAVLELANWGHTEALQPLFELLGVQDQRVRWAAIQALWRLGGPAVVDRIIPLLKDDDDVIRTLAAYALGQMRDERAIEPLISSLNDASSGVQLAASLALGRFGSQVVPRFMECIEMQECNTDKLDHSFRAMVDPDAVEPLTTALTNSNPQVRVHAARFLANFDDERARQSLQKALADPDPDVRHDAKVSLSMLTSKPGTEFESD